MRITVDTKADSLSEIKHVISLLQAVVGNNDTPVYTNYNTNASSPTAAYSPMSIFSDDQPSQSSAGSSPSATATSSSGQTSSYNLFNMLSSPSESQQSQPTASTASQPKSIPYTNADDILEQFSDEESASDTPETSYSSEEEDRSSDDDDNYRIIPY